MKYLSRPYTTILALSVVFLSSFFFIRSASIKKINAVANTTLRFDTTQITAIAPDLSQGQFWPNVAIDSNGVSHVVFIKGGTNDLLYTNNKNGAFSAPTNLDAITTIGQDSRPALVFANGSLHLLYTVNQREVYYRQGDMNGTWGPRVLIKSATYRSYGGGIAVDSSGTVHVTWVDERCGNFNIFYRTYSGGTLGPEMMPMGNDCVLKNFTRIVLINNRPHVIFRYKNDVYYTKYNGSTWSPALNLSNNTAAATNNPAIGTNGTNLYVAWAEGINNHDVFMRYSTDEGNNWSAAITVAGKPEMEEYPTITWSTATNRGYIVWSDANVTEKKTEIFFEEFDAVPAAFTNPVRLTCITDNSDIPHVNANGGNVSVVWQDRNQGGTLQIYGVGGQAGAGLTTSVCAAAPTNGPTVTGGPTVTPGAATPTPTPTKVPTRTPTPSPTPFQIPTPDAATLRRLSLRSGNDPSECFGVEWVAFYTLASVLIIMAIHFAIHIRKEFNIWGMAFYFAFGGVITWYIHSCDFSFVGLIIGFILSFLFY